MLLISGNQRSLLHGRVLVSRAGMLKNYLKIALRGLWRSKGYAAINVAGLSVAFCTSIFLFLTAWHHLTFDSFHQDGDRIFQTYFFSNDPENAERSGSMPLPLTPALEEEFPEVEAAARIMTMGSQVEYKGNYFDKTITTTDADFLRIFSFPMIRGDRETALNDPGSIVISRDMAADVFGEEDPLNKQLKIGANGESKVYIVTGVLENAPDNSSIQYSALVRIENHPGYQTDKDNWDAYSHTVFIKLAPKAIREKLTARLKPFTEKYFPDSFQVLENKGAVPDKQGDIFALRLQPLSRVHFDPEIAEIGAGTPAVLIYAMLGIAFFILLIAGINFINLNVARSFTRAREVGVRKSLGALKSQLFVQIWGEAAILCLAGFLAGGILAWLLLPEFNALFQARLDPSRLFQPDFLALMLCVFALITLTAGGYPAWQLSRFDPVEVLKGKVSLKRPGIVRNSLIIVQFAMASLLICCTITAARQVNYLRKRPVGFEKEQVISIPVGNRVNGRQALTRLRNIFAADPQVLSVTGTGVNLGIGRDRSSSRSVMSFTYKGKEISTDWLLIDYDYLKTLNIELLAGREFDPAYPSDADNRVIITESMARMLGKDDPVGTFFQSDDGGIRYQVIGLIPDFHLYSLANEVQPITMHLSGTEPVSYIFVRVSPQSLAGAMDKLKHAWKEAAPRSEFLASFLDQNIDAQYKDEERLSQVFGFASGIAIVLSCLGLFAIALMVIEQRTKEIGIRKVLGASIAGIVVVLSRDFVKLVLAALLIALPSAWFFMQQWLNNYPYRIEISAGIFVLISLVILLVALLTISYQSIRAALMNPVKSLRSE